MTIGVDQWNALKNQAQIWGTKVVAVYNRPAPPALQADKNKLLSSAKTIKTLIEKVFGTFDQLKHVELGVIPLIIPVAVIGTAAALITKWTYDYNIYTKKLAEYDRLVGQGMAPATAAKVLDITGASGSIINQAGKLMPWIVGGIVLWTFRDKLKRLVG